MLQPPKLSRTVFPVSGRSGVIPQIAPFVLGSAQLPTQQRSKDSCLTQDHRPRWKEIRNTVPKQSPGYCWASNWAGSLPPVCGSASVTQDHHTLSLSLPPSLLCQFRTGLLCLIQFQGPAGTLLSLLPLSVITSLAAPSSPATQALGSFLALNRFVSSRFIQRPFWFCCTALLESLWPAHQLKDVVKISRAQCVGSEVRDAGLIGPFGLVLLLPLIPVPPVGLMGLVCIHEEIVLSRSVMSDFATHGL